MRKHIDRAALFNSLSDAKTVEEIFAAIQAAPAEDVEPVRQGRWIDGNEGKWNTVILPKCSVCHTPFYGIETERYHYCPNCGARMEE